MAKPLDKQIIKVNTGHERHRGSPGLEVGVANRRGALGEEVHARSQARRREEASDLSVTRLCGTASSANG